MDAGKGRWLEAETWYLAMMTVKSTWPVLMDFDNAFDFLFPPRSFADNCQLSYSLIRSIKISHRLKLH
jgi:hypothetical protein